MNAPPVTAFYVAWIASGAKDLSLPAGSTHVTLPQEFVDSLPAGAHGFEVLAIEAGGNQTITAGSFVTN